MNKKYIKIIKKIMIVVVFITLFISVIGSSTDAASADEMWQKAGNWFGSVETDNNSEQAVRVINQFVTMVNIIGTTIIVLATIFLGIKYIIGSIESKAEVKESMITLLVACIFFFGWSSISSILIPNGRLVLSSTTDTSYTYFVGRVFNTGVFVLNMAAILAVIFVGVRYIFSGASGKAELKGKSVYFIIGIILAFCSVSVLTFLSNVINEMIKS